MSAAPRQPRILFLTQLYPPVFGGGARFLSNLRRILTRQGFETVVVTGNRGIANELEPNVSRVPTPGGERFARLGAYSYALLSPALLLAHARRYDIIHTLGASHSVYSSILTARLLGKKVVIGSVQNRDDDPGGILQERFGRLKNWLFSRADRFICCNSYQVGAYAGAGYPAGKVRLILNGVDTSRFFPSDSPQAKATLRQKLGLPAEGFVLLSIGAIIHRKGMDLLIESWNRFRAGGGRGTLVLVGPQSSRDPGSGVDDSFVKDLKGSLSRNRADDSVIFTGKVDNVPEYLRAADAFALMSRGEGFPFALLEAMSSGLPFLMWNLPDYGGYSLTDQAHGFPAAPVRYPAARGEAGHSGRQRGNHASDGGGGPAIGERPGHRALCRGAHQSVSGARRAMTPPLRVALVIGQLHAGGSERQLVELALGLRGGSCAPYVYCLSEVTEPFGPLLQKAGVPLRVLPRRRSFEPRRVIALARFLRDDRIDVVLSYAMPVNLYAFLALLLYRRSYFLASSRTAEMTESPLRTRVNALVYRRSGRIVANSRFGAESTSRIYGVSLDRIEVIHNGVDSSRFAYQGGQEEARRALGLPATAPVVGLVGRLTSEKRADSFLEAARHVTSRIPECRFLVVGGGDLLEPMKKLATEMGLDSKVMFTGERNDIDRVLAALDLLALSSDFEGLPNVVMEAMAAGRPVVATDLGGCRELIVEGVTGFLVPVGDPGAMAEGMIQVLSLPDRGRSLGAAGSERIRSEFSIAAMVEHFAALFLNVRGKNVPAS